MRDQESKAGQQRAALEVEVKKSQEEVALLAQRLYEQERAAKNSREVLEEAARDRLMGLQDAVKKSRAERDALQEKIRDLQRDGLAADRSRRFLPKYTNRSASRNTAAMSRGTTRDRWRPCRMPSRDRRTRRTQEDPRLQRTERRPHSETILEDLNCGVIIGDANGNVSRINSIATQMLGVVACRHPESAVDTDHQG